MLPSERTGRVPTGVAVSPARAVRCTAHRAAHRAAWGVLLLLLAGALPAAAARASAPTLPSVLPPAAATMPADTLPGPPARVLLLHDTSDTFGQRSYRQAVRALQYAKQPFDAYDLTAPDPAASDSSASDSSASRSDTLAAPRPELPALGGYASVLTATEYLWKLSEEDAARLRGYVEQGGGLAVLYRGWHEALASIFGTPEASEPVFRTFRAEEMTFPHTLMPGDSSLTLAPQEVSCYAIAPGPRAEVLLRDETGAAGDGDGTPLAWRLRYGQGRVVYWNVTLLANRRYRGFVNQSLALVQPRTVRPMANWAAVFLDDFPAPTQGAPREPVASEFGLSPAAFYARQWYPDMKQLADEFGLTYTAAPVFSYNDRTAPPFPMDTWLATRVRADGLPVAYTKWMVERVQADGGELGIHGYNHRPLSLQFWPGQQPMEQSLRATRERWALDSLATNAPRVYVPPMNVIDSTGVAALQAALPSVDVIAGYYTGREEQGQGREFGPEPWGSGVLYALPRNTSSYFFTDEQRLRMLSLLHTVGAWNHFLHPDELYPNEDRYASFRDQGIEPPAEGFTWRGEGGLYHQLRSWLAFAREHYPWLRYMSASEAVLAMRRYTQTPVEWTSGEDDLAVRAEGVSAEDPLHLTVYAEHGDQLTGVRGGEILQSGRLSFLNYHILRMEAPLLTVSFASAGTSARRSVPAAQQ